MIEMPAIDGLQAERIQPAQPRTADDGFSRLLDQHTPRAPKPDADGPRVDEEAVVRARLVDGAPVEVPMCLVATGRLAYGAEVEAVQDASARGVDGAGARRPAEAPATRLVASLVPGRTPRVVIGDAGAGSPVPPPARGAEGAGERGSARATERSESSPHPAEIAGQLPAERLMRSLPTEHGAVVVFRDYRLDRDEVRAVADALARGVRSLASSVARVVVNGVTVFQPGHRPERRGE